MPELPEVETVTRQIRPGLVGRSVTAARVSWARTLGGVSRAAFQGAVVGRRLTGVERRGKYIVIALADGEQDAGALVCHLRMTGHMQVETADWDPGPFAKVRLDLDDGRAFHFLDVRKFGRVVFTREPRTLLATLGPEPLSEAFTPAWLAEALRARRRAVKPLLLDQTFLAGLGNIYVDESLFRARIHPLRPSHRISRERARALHREIRAVLTEAIAREGSSFDAFYRTPDGRPGGYQHAFRVYGRTDEPCPRCGTLIRRLVVGQRGTHVCPRCQPSPRRRQRARGV